MLDGSLRAKRIDYKKDMYTASNNTYYFFRQRHQMFWLQQRQQLGVPRDAHP